MSHQNSPNLASPRYQVDSNLVILSLPYSFLIDSKKWTYETKTGLWQGQFEWSKALVPYAVLSRHQLENIRIIDNIGSLRDTVMALNYNGVSDVNHVKLVEPQLNNQLITVSINGNETFINNCRSEILKTYNHISFKKILLRDSNFLAISANFLLTLNCIASRYAVEILIGANETDFKSNAHSCDSNYVYILGSTDRLSFAETDVRVSIDTLLNGSFVDKISVPLSMVPTLGGVNMANFAELTRESRVNVYLPYMLPSLKVLTLIRDTDDMSIWFSSKNVSEVILSKKILCDLRDVVDPRQNQQAHLFTQEVKVSKEKMDLVSLYYRSELLSIMFKHGTFIQVPELGELQDDVVVVQGSTLESLQNTLTDFALLCSKFYTFELDFLKIDSFPVDLEYFLISLVSLKRSCIVTFNKSGLRFVGGMTEIHELIGELTADISRNSLFAKLIEGADFRASIAMELANDQKDFVSGKKNGKIIKIYNQVNQIPSIKFEPFNSLNFIIRLSMFHSSRQDHAAALKFNILAQTVKLLEMELPAEKKFNIPEAFHKSIIGNGGQVIQSIMKKYNVFIKFISYTNDTKKNDPNVTETGRNLYSLQRRDNVIIKCPMKNLKNIEFAKYEIDHLVKQCCENSIMTTYGTSVVYNTVRFNLLRSHYQLLIRSRNYDLQFISDLEREHATYISFPKTIDEFKENSSLPIMIKGNDAKARVCAQHLQELLPHSQEFRIEHLPEIFSSVTDSKCIEFRSKIVIPFRVLLDAEIVVVPKNKESYTNPGHIIYLSSYSKENLEEASMQLSHYLKSNHLVVAEERPLNFNPVLSVEEAVSPKKQLSYRNNKTPGLSPEKIYAKTVPRYSPNFNSPGRLDSLDLIPVPFDSGNSKSPKKSMARKKSFSPLQTITNQPIVGQNGKAPSPVQTAASSATNMLKY